MERSQVRDLAQAPAERQKRLALNLLGVGGVGTNVLNLFRHERIRKYYTVRAWDFDRVEVHNLNRTLLFGVGQLGWEKTRAVLYRMRQLVGDAEKFFLGSINAQVTSETQLPMGLVLDARDVVDPEQLPERTWLKLAYDGGSQVGFNFRPAVTARLILDLTGGRATYEVTPSFFVPAALLAVLALNFARYLNFLEITDHRAGTVQFDLDEVALGVAYRWVPEEDA